MNNEEVIVSQVERIKAICSQPLTNQGKGLDEVGERQRRRKILILRESCKRALWFADSFNVDIISLLVETKKTKEQLTVDISIPSSLPGISTQSPSDAADMVHKILYLLDRFAISDEFYHQLSMIQTSLPRSYKIKEARQRINSKVKLMRLPKPYFGCYRSFKESLMESVLAEVRCVY